MVFNFTAFYCDYKIGWPKYRFSFQLNIGDRSTVAGQKILEDDAEAVRRPEKYARKWLKQAQVNKTIC